MTGCLPPAAWFRGKGGALAGKAPVLAPALQEHVGVPGDEEAAVARAEGDAGLVASVVVASAGDAEVEAPGDGDALAGVGLRVLAVPSLDAAQAAGDETLLRSTFRGSVFEAVPLTV